MSNNMMKYESTKMSDGLTVTDLRSLGIKVAQPPVAEEQYGGAKVLSFEMATGNPEVCKGQVRFCDLEYISDSKNTDKPIGKRRPCIIFQTAPFNQKKKNICVIPMSSSTIYNTDDEILSLTIKDEVCGDRVSYVCVDRPLYIQYERLGNYVGEAPIELMTYLDVYYRQRLGL